MLSILVDVLSYSPVVCMTGSIVSCCCVTRGQPYQLAFLVIVLVPDVELGPSVLQDAFQGDGPFETLPLDLKGSILLN